MKHLLFAASLAALPVLGFGAASHRSVRSLPLLARLGAALAMGYVSLTATAVLLSTFGVPWSIPALALLPLAISAALWRTWRRAAPVPRRPFRPSASVAWLALAAGGLGAVHLIVALLTAAATSIDFLLFWGVKAARFAQARSVDAALLRWPYFVHAVPDYPPAVPVVQAWSVLWTGEQPWRVVPLTTALWAVAAAPLLLELLRARSVSNDDHAAAVTAFWLSALCISLARSLSGGSAEAPLLFFETLAVAALLQEPAEPVEPAGEAPSRFLPALMLAGAVLTKVEGSAALLFVAAGTLVRDVGRLGPWPAVRGTLRLVSGGIAALATWFLFQATHGLPVGFRAHGELWSLHARFLPEILRGLPRNLDAGTLGLSWLIPLTLLALAMSRASVRPLLPALSLAAGILAFLVFDYLHDDRSPSERIRWTTPRVSQPALSAVILAAGVATSRMSGRAPD
jgi:hypothetical protein